MSWYSDIDWEGLIGTAAQIAADRKRQEKQGDTKNIPLTPQEQWIFDRQQETYGYSPARAFSNESAFQVLQNMGSPGAQFKPEYKSDYMKGQQLPNSGVQGMDFSKMPKYWRGTYEAGKPFVPGKEPDAGIGGSYGPPTGGIQTPPPNSTVPDPYGPTVSPGGGDNTGRGPVRGGRAGEPLNRDLPVDPAGWGGPGMAGVDALFGSDNIEFGRTLGNIMRPDGQVDPQKATGWLNNLLSSRGWDVAERIVKGLGNMSVPLLGTLGAYLMNLLQQKRVGGGNGGNVGGPPPGGSAGGF